MKVLVAVKRVPDGNAPLRLKPDGSGVDLASMPMRINPFDEAALELAVQWKEAGLIGEIIAVSLGGEACQETLRHALALGADRAIRIASDLNLEPLAVAKLLHAVAAREQPDLILLGKQSSDDDNAQTAPMLAALLNWPQGLFASALAFRAGQLRVTREIEGGQEVLALPLPAVISADLRLANPRYLKLPQLLAAKKKSIATLHPSELGVEIAPRLVRQNIDAPPQRRLSRNVADVAELLTCLRAEGLLQDAPQASICNKGKSMPAGLSLPPKRDFIWLSQPDHPSTSSGRTGIQKRTDSSSRALILTEHDGVKLHPALHHVVSAASQLADDITLFVAGNAALATEAATLAGVSRVLLVDAPHFTHPLAEDLAPLLAQAVRDLNATVLLAAATPFGKAILPRAAALLDCAMLSDVTAIQAPDIFTRPIHASEALATLCNPEPIKILTVRTAAFAPVATQVAAPIETRPAPAAASSAIWISSSQADSSRPTLSTAKVVIAGGRGLGSNEQFQALLEPLADRLNAAIGATRAAVDNGFISNDHQIGQTGAIVAPDFYFAIGLSGAAQHLAGMRDARVIVAINKDLSAPICAQADYVLEGDLFEVLPALIRALDL